MPNHKSYKNVLPIPIDDISMKDIESDFRDLQAYNTNSRLDHDDAGEAAQDSQYLKGDLPYKSRSNTLNENKKQSGDTDFPLRDGSQTLLRNPLTEYENQLGGQNSQGEAANGEASQLGRLQELSDAHSIDLPQRPITQSGDHKNSGLSQTETDDLLHNIESLPESFQPLTETLNLKKSRHNLKSYDSYQPGKVDYRGTSLETAMPDDDHKLRGNKEVQSPLQTSSGKHKGLISREMAGSDAYSDEKMAEMMEYLKSEQKSQQADIENIDVMPNDILKDETDDRRYGGIPDMPVPTTDPIHQRSPTDRPNGRHHGDYSSHRSRNQRKHFRGHGSVRKGKNRVNAPYTRGQPAETNITGQDAVAEMIRLGNKEQMNDTFYDIVDKGGDKVEIPVSGTPAWHTLIHGHRDIVVGGAFIGGVGITIIIVAIIIMLMNRRKRVKAMNANNNKVYRKLGNTQEQARLKKPQHSLFPLSSDDESEEENTVFNYMTNIHHRDHH